VLTNGCGGERVSTMTTAGERVALPGAGRLPMVSVVMPVRNESRFIVQSITSVMEQDYSPHRLEVVVADGRSTDDTRDRVQQMQTRYDNLYLVDNPQQVMPSGANIAIQKASGDLILLLGGHSAVPPDYVRRCAQRLVELDADCVGGALETVGEGYVGGAVALAMSSRFGVGTASFRTAGREAEPRETDTVAFGLYRREVFERIGGFDEELVRNQDDEFNVRLTQSGGKIWLDPSIRSLYYSRAALDSLWKQYFQYGYYKIRLIQKRGAVPSWRHVVPASFLLALIAGLVATLITGNPLWSGLVLGPYLAASAGASARIALQSGASYLPLLPLVFLTLHLGYGCGFLAGIFRFGVIERGLEEEE